MNPTKTKTSYIKLLINVYSKLDLTKCVIHSNIVEHCEYDNAAMLLTRVTRQGFKDSAKNVEDMIIEERLAQSYRTNRQRLE